MFNKHLAVFLNWMCRAHFISTELEVTLPFPSAFRCCRILVPRYFCFLSSFCGLTENHFYSSLLRKESLSGYQERKLLFVHLHMPVLQPFVAMLGHRGLGQMSFHLPLTPQCCDHWGVPRKDWTTYFFSKLTMFPIHSNTFLPTSETPWCR